MERRGEERRGEERRGRNNRKNNNNNCVRKEGVCEKNVSVYVRVRARVPKGDSLSSVFLILSPASSMLPFTWYFFPAGGRRGGREREREGEKEREREKEREGERG